MDWIVSGQAGHPVQGEPGAQRQDSLLQVGAIPWQGGEFEHRFSIESLVFLWLKDRFDREKDWIAPVDLNIDGINSLTVDLFWKIDRIDSINQSFSKIDESDSLMVDHF